MRSILLGAVLALCGCDSAGDAACADCQVSFTTPQCDSFAKSQGCASGEAVVDKTLCSGMVTACQFHGCPTGVAIMCTTGGDAGAD